MRELFEAVPQIDAREAVRRAARRPQRRRFYQSVTVAPGEDGFAVNLDGKPARTPAVRVLAAPTRSLAQALAAEWEAQCEIIDPASMPLTRLANTVIDGVAERIEPVIEEIGKYLESDLVFYRAEAPPGLVERQARHWDPIVRWAADALGARFASGRGVVHVAQSQPALAAARAAIPRDPWRAGAVHVVTTLTGSALIALALAHGHAQPADAWQAAHVDEDWNMEQWGADQLALERRAHRGAEFDAAVKVLASGKV